MFKYWINNIFFNYQTFNENKICIIFHEASNDINNEILYYLDSINIKLIILPPDFTRFLQPFHLAINKQFKMALKKEYLTVQQKLDLIFENSFTSANKDIIKLVVDIWYNENNIKKKVIIVYSDCGISQKLDDSETKYLDSLI